MITKDMIISDVLALDDGTAEVFLSSGMHCIGCPVSRGETIEEASLVHGIDADRLVEKLNDYLEGKK
ncbi:MAG: DUF1858 domain-containing protein [Clostridia bacterium]|nr:DUF1858 domain-containing protein [Clostridia bacterium]